MLHKLDLLHNLKIIEEFLGKTKSSTAAYSDVREERRRVLTTKLPIRLGYARGLLIKRLIIYTSIMGFLCVLSPYGQAEDAVQNIEYFDTTDEDINELEVKDNKINDNNLPNIQNNIEYAELKTCTSGKIIALNKITATSKELLLKPNEPQFFGNIQIKLHKCIKNLDPYNGDNYMLLTITEHKIDEDPMLVFQGWLISSSISVSTFEHPIYEIFAKDCL